MNREKKYNCNNCDKKYSTYNSLWTHNKIHHNGIKTEKTIVEKQTENPEIIVETETEYGCRICNKTYKHKQTRYRHEKTCNGIKQPSIELEVEKTKLETEKTKQETERIKQESLKLQIKLQSMKRIDTKTFKAMNKILMDRSTHNTTNNNVININFPNILSIGKENVVKTLTRSEKKYILDSRWCSIDKMVEIVHCRNHNTFKNILITNLKDKFAYKYDETKGYFITGNKTDFLDDVMTFRMIDLETIYEELSTANKIDGKTKKLIQEFLDKMENEEPFSYGDVEYPNYKSYKMNNIKILLYNNRDRVTNDIALLIGDNKISNEIPNNEIIS